MIVAIGGFAGPMSSAQTSHAIVPFTINVPDATLADLQERLALTRLPDEISDTGWVYLRHQPVVSAGDT